MYQTTIDSAQNATVNKVKIQIKRLIAATVAVFFAFTGVITTAGAATADPVEPQSPFTITTTGLDSKWDEEVILESGGVIGFKVQYKPELFPEAPVPFTATFEFPDWISIGNDFVAELEENDLVSSVVINGSVLTVIFAADAREQSNSQGGWEMKLTVKEHLVSELETFTWDLNGKKTNLEVIIKGKDDELANFKDSVGKSLGGFSPDLRSYIIQTESEGKIDLSFKDEIKNAVFNYTLNIDAATDLTDYSIVDKLSPYLSFDEGSLTSEVVTWDENGLNKKPAVSFENFDTPAYESVGNTLTIDGIDLAAPAKLEFKYRAKFNEEKLQELLNVLQTQLASYNGWDNVPFSEDILNTATFNAGSTSEIKREAKVTIDGVAEGLSNPDYGHAFKKSNNVPTNPRPIVEPGKADGNGVRLLSTPLEFEYKLTANLSHFDPKNPKKEMVEDVILTDTLPVGVEWRDGEKFTVKSGNTDVTFAEVADANTALTTGQYRIIGNSLEVNLGKEPVDYQITLGVKLVSVTGDATSENLLFENFKFTNSANYTHTSLNSKGEKVTQKVPVESTGEVRSELTPKPGDIDNSEFFNKASPNSSMSVRPGETVNVPFTFTAKDVDLENSTIIDYIDPKVFGEIEPSSVVLEGSINNTEIAAADARKFFDLNLDGDGNLLITLTEEGAKLSHGADTLDLMVTIPTLPIQGKGSIWINNSAMLKGVREDVTFSSSTSTVGTSRGGELEVNKTVLDQKSDSWVNNLRVEIEDNKLVATEFTFRIQMVAHGSYGTFGILPIDDVLPQGLAFDGFVNADGTRSKTPKEIRQGNLTATFVEAGGKETIEIRQNDGTSIGSGADVELQFVVKVTAFTPDIALINRIGGTSAAIIPTNDYPIAVAKVDSDDPGNFVITDTEARFELFDNQDLNGEPLVTDIFVDQGRLVIEKDGVNVIPAVKQPGTYYLVERKAPAGYILPENADPIPIVVSTKDPVGTATIQNDPIPAYAVGDYTWIDLNRNGIQDGNEPVLEGVTVTITDENGDEVKDIFGDVVKAVETDEKGFYLFDQLPKGKYKVHFELVNEDHKAQYSWTETKADGVDTEKNSDADTASETYGWSDVFELGDKNANIKTPKEYKEIVGEDGQTFKARKGIDPTWDAGVVVKTYAVGDYVWIDTNRDGIQDDDEDVLPGVTVILLDSEGTEVARKTTDEKGLYLFDELAPGDYQVKFELTPEQAAKYKFTDQNEGEDNSADSDVDPGTGLTVKFTLGDESVIKDYDAQDVKASEGIDPTWDAGVVLQMVSVGDLVWIDENRDGRQGEDEPGIEDILLKIVGPDGNPVTDVFGNDVEPQRTDANGNYEFPNLPVLKEGESYTVVIDREDKDTQDTLALYAPTTSNEGDREGDSDAWEAKSQDLTKDGQEDLTLDFGFVVKSYAIGDFVWIDSDRNGTQDEGELPLEDVTVTLYRVVDGEDVKVTEDIAGKEFGVVRTNAEGRYIFDNLPAGTYKVHFELTEEQKETFSFTVADAQTEVEDVVVDEVDSDADQKTGWTTEFILDDSNEGLTQEYDIEGGLKATQGIDPTWDAGVIYKKVSVGDYVWYDQNGDGIQDSDKIDGKKREPGIKDVLLKISKIDADGEEHPLMDGDAEWPTERTDADGHYSFDDLPALLKGEKYRVTIVADEQSTIDALEPYVPTKQGAGDDREKDSSTDFSDSIIDLVADGSHDPSLDFGFVLKSVSVGDLVWVDSNRDGLQDEGEPGIPGVVLELVGPDGEPVVDIYGEPVGPVTTDENGKYTFDNLPVLEEGQVYTVVIDQEDDSTVQALKPYLPTVAGAGDDRAQDSSTDSAESIILTEDGERDSTLDFGFIEKSYGIGDVIWIDSNNNGIQDKGEEPLAGVTVTLFSVDSDGKLTKVTADIDGNAIVPVTTNANGEYLFDNLPAGTYQVAFELTKEQASKYVFTSLKAGKNEQVDSNANPVTGYTQDIVLDESNTQLDMNYRNGDFVASQGIDPTWDAGVVNKTYAIGDIVWVDTNRDGIQGETEVLEGVTVTLLNGKGDVITSTKTDKNGRYIFDVLPAGEYQVKFELTKEQAAKYKFTSVNSGKDAKADSDADLATGLTKVFKLDDNTADLTTDYKDQAFQANQGIDPTWDAGVVLKSVAVGDKVWEDKNGDGRQDKNEPGIPGVVLELTGPDGKPVTDIFGNPVGPVTTDENGVYNFKDLPVLKEGQCYTVTINKEKSAKALEKYLPTKEGVGDSSGDSSSWTVCSGDLTEDGDVDLTLDFGFVLNPKFMPVTGTNALLPATIALVALGGGAFLVMRARRTSGSRRL